MRPLPEFRLHRPEALSGALELLDALGDCRPIAGGTDLLLFLRDGTIRARHLVDVTGIDEMRGISLEDGEIRIGAATPLSEVAASELIAEMAPALAEAVSQIGSAQTRNQGTIGGNICNASPAADSAPPLLVLDARLDVSSKAGGRTIPVGELFAGPKVNSLERGELVKAIRIPEPTEGSGASFQKLGRRRGSTLSVVNAAAYVKLDGGRCSAARLALGAIATTPIRVTPAEGLLVGREPTEAVIEAAASACRECVSPVDDIRGSAGYRRDMSAVLVRRAITGALRRAGVD
jgi:CO/xanthine dehydrogenase FAD-binding subunit